MPVFDLIVIGGGAAGFFGAIQAAEHRPGLKVLILEKTNKLLSKVRISGGGRCNVTHHCDDPVRLSRHYPRGEKPLRPLFKRFGAHETVQWFASKGVHLKTEDDGRMFPVTDNSQTIIDCFLSEADRLRIRIETGEAVVGILRQDEIFEITSATGKKYRSVRVLVAIGGNAKPQGYGFIDAVGHRITPPIPSLFTFNDSEKAFADLMGVSVPTAMVRIAGTQFRQEGPLLITHWGLSGPAVIRLSAWAAEHLYQKQYHFTVLVSWIGVMEEEVLRMYLQEQKKARQKQKVWGHPLFELPQRLWIRLCALADIPEGKVWGEVSHKNVNRLLERLLKCPFLIKGKTTFKEEFVTCGGVDLNDVDRETMESRRVKGLYFAGEVLNIDGETGGFNFQAAWTTAHVAAISAFGNN